MESEYLITSQVYNKFDEYKQTVLLSDSIRAKSPQEAEESFREIYDIDHHIVKIFSVVPL